MQTSLPPSRMNACYPLQAKAGSSRGPAPCADGQCAPCAYVAAFGRRLQRGRFFYTPCLSWKDFVPDYPHSESGFCDGTAPSATENRVLPAFLEMLVDEPQNYFAN